MTFNNAKGLHNEDEVTIKETGEIVTILQAYPSENGKYIVLEYDNGNTYYNDEVKWNDDLQESGVDIMYTLKTAETKVRDYTEFILHQHDLSIYRNDTNRKIYDKVVEKCMTDLANPELLKLFTNAPQLEYFVRQTMLYLILGWNGNLLGEYVRGWNIQSLIFMERNGDYYV